jgi:hypothetical protein
VKRPVALFIAILLAAVLLSACGCPVNLTDTAPDTVERSVTPAPEQSVPRHTSSPGISSDGFITADVQTRDGGWELNRTIIIK